jgi:DNA-binding NarL/FixJ family response regulator
LLADATRGAEDRARTAETDRLGLSPWEADVLTLLVEGCSNQETGERLYVSAKTVERHLGNLYRKLDVTNRTRAAAYAIRHGVGTAAS